MSSLVQRQSERQGIFLVALSPFKRGAGGAKYQPYPLYPPFFNVILGFNPRIQVKNHPNLLPLKTQTLTYPPPKILGGARGGFKTSSNFPSLYLKYTLIIYKISVIIRFVKTTTRQR